MSSKALKVLLALILAIGLMPAINTQQAFAVPASAVSVTEADGTTVKECDTSANASGNGWEWSKTGTLTITGTIAKVSVGASFGSDVTIKASVAASNAAIVTDSGAAIESAMAANEVTIDATESNLLVKTSAANKSAITVAQNLVVLGAENAKTLTVDEAISDDATAAVAVAGTVELAAMSSMVAESVEGAGITVDGSLTGAVISTDTTVINGSVSGNVTSADAVTVATAGNAVIDGDIILTADDIAVTVGNGLAGTGSYYSASIAGDITTDDATAKSLGTVSIGNAAAVQNPQAVTVDGSIAPTKDTVTVFGTATIKGAISVDASKTLTVERGAVVSGAITLGIGAELVNNSDSDIPVSCTDGRTDVAKANTTFTFATFSADMDKKSFDYTAKNLNAADAIKDHVSVYEANGQKVTSPFASDYTFKIFQADDYALNGAAATDLAASLVESGNYVAAVTKVTPGTEIHTVAFTVNKGTLANVYTVINDQQYTGDELNPVVTAMYVSERNVDGTIKTEAAIDNTGEKNFTVAYSDNTAVGTAKVALAFGANSSIKAGTVNGTFSITQADPAKNLAGATVKLIKGMDAAHPVVYAGTDITAANLTAATTGTGIVESIKIGSNTIAQANFGTTLAFSLASDPQGKTAIDKIDAAGTYYLVISNGTTGSYVNKKVVSIVVADGATLSKMTPEFGAFSAASYTGPNTQPAKTTLTFSDPAGTMGDVVFKANQYKIARTDAGLSNITDGTKAKVQTIVITDTKSPYYMATVSVDTVPSAQFDVRALDLSDKSLALKVQTTTAAGVEKDGLESISAVYKASAYNLADAVAGNVVNEKDYNVKKIMATVNGDTFDISAIVDAEIEGYAKNVGSYAVKVEANSVNAAGVTKTASVANAVKVTPYDLSADYANIKFAAAATSVNYTAEAGYPAKLKAVEFGNSGHTVVIPEGEVAFEVYKRTGGTVSGSAITPIDAGTYRVYINAASKNFTGSTKSAGLTNNTVYFDYAIAAVSFATVKIELDQSNGYYPVSSAPVKPQVTATLGDIVLDPTAYAVDYTKIKAGQGKYDLTVTPAAGNKNFTANTKVVTPINVVGATDLRTAKVTLDYGVDGATSYTYTVANGYAKVFNAPTVVLTLADGTVLKSSNNDFTAVTATPKASAVNKYTWSPGITLDPSIASKYLNADKVSIPNWIIAPASMEDAVVEDVPNYNVKDGSTAVGVVAPKVTFNGATLTSGTDYDLVYYSVDPDGVKSKLANGVADIKAVGTYYVEAVGMQVADFTGTGSFDKETVTAAKTFEVTKNSIGNATLSFSALNTAGYGEALPGMTLTVSGATVAPAEYSLRYFYDAACLNPVVDANGNIAAASEIGMYYVKAEAKASSKLFAGTTKSAAAKQLVITKATVTPVVGSLTPSYNGEAKAVVVAASSAPNAPVLKEGVDYKVEYSIGGKAVSSAVNAGTYSYKITSLAGGHYTFTTITAGDFVIGKVTVSNAAAVSATNGQLVADSIKPQVFKGSAVAIKPVPTNLGVKVLANDGSTKVIPLTAGVDCMIDSYTANNAIGNAKVNYTFGTTVSNNMTDTAAYIDFKIVAANDLSLATVAAVSDQEATGKAVEPALNVTMDGKKLVANTDYSIVYYNNVNPGRAWAVITGIDSGSYAGTQTVYFNIVKAPGTTERIEGATRFETMSNLVSGGFESAETVIVTNGMKAPDALAASGLAGVSNAPIITTEGEALNAFAAETISNLGASKAIVLGDEASISGAVVASLEAMGLSVERVQGDTRIETNLAIYEAGKASYGKTAILASGWEAADALSAASYAYATGSAVFLANEDGSVDERISEILLSGAFDRVIVLGGEDRVSAKERMELKAGLGETAVVEFAGTDRFDTSAQLIEFAAAEGAVNFSTVYATTGFNFADALAAGAPAGKQGIPVLLVADDANAYKAIDSVLGGHKADIDTVDILGDTNAVSKKVEDYIKASLK